MERGVWALKRKRGSWLAVGGDDTAKGASSQRAEAEAGVMVGSGAGGDGEENGIGGGVVVQPVHAGGERLPGWFFMYSSFGILLVYCVVLIASLHSQDSIQCPLTKQPPFHAKR